LKVRLVGSDGTQHGVVDFRDARRMADEEGLDLIEVSPNAVPPVVKIIDYGKFKYELQKKTNESKKKQAIVHLKEIQFRPNIEKHDLEVKMKKIVQFLGQGDKVRLVMQFRGREIAYKKAGLVKFTSIVELIVSEGAMVESEPKFMGSRILTIVAPVKK
jgi:translation initiation factor IF-3